MIMLVVHGERALLGRKKIWQRGMYSCLAGFMEHGEGIDDAVRREVKEETSIEVGEVRFFASQPWPFPYTLLLGCVGEGRGNVRVEEELEEARWFTRQEVKEMVIRGEKGEKGLFVPDKRAIAGWLCRAFAEENNITVFEGGDKRKCRL